MSDTEIGRLAYEGQIAAVKENIKATPSLVKRKDSAGRLPIHWAASGGHTEIASFLLENGSPVDPPDELLWTPLIIAASAGHEDIVSLLIKNGADVNARSETGHSAIEYASSKNRIQILKDLIAQGANVNAKDNMGFTPLHRASSKGHFEAMKILLTCPHIEVNVQDKFGNSPLHMVCQEGREQEAYLLLEHGALIELKNGESLTALQVSTPNLEPKLRDYLARIRQQRK